MPKLPTPNEVDPVTSQIKQMYTDAVSAPPPFTPPANPKDKPIDGVEYDDGGFPSMPADITLLGSQQLGQLFQAVEAWYEYVNSVLTDADLNKEKADNFASAVRARVKQELRKDHTQDETDEYFKIDMRYVEATAEYLQAQTLKKRLESAQKMISKRFQLVSREISRRAGDWENSQMNPEKRFSSGYNRTPNVPRLK